jgi:glycosyltransferase involved in cell wall biosynthesis
MHILVVDRRPPCDLLQGNALIGQRLFRRLRHHHLTLICPAPAEHLHYYAAELAQLFDDVHLVPRPRFPTALKGVVEPALVQSGLPGLGAVARGATLAFSMQLQRLLSACRFDVLHIRQLPMAGYTISLDHPATLLELIDSEALQSERRLRWNAPHTWLRYAAANLLEGWAARRFAVCTTVAEADARAVRRLAPGLEVEVIPNGVDADYFAPLALPEEPASIIFTGAMSFPPNVAAALMFYHEILPRIRRNVPNARFIIAGRDPTPEIAALAADPAVTVTGYVDDLRPLMAQASLVVCPMVNGSGIKNKVLEALAMARPVVTTSLGVEALDVVDGRDVRVADTPAAFADAVGALLRDAHARRRLGEAGRVHISQRYTWEACAARYDALYGRLAGLGE